MGGNRFGRTVTQRTPKPAGLGRPLPASKWTARPARCWKQSLLRWVGLVEVGALFSFLVLVPPFCGCAATFEFSVTAAKRRQTKWSGTQTKWSGTQTTDIKRRRRPKQPRWEMSSIMPSMYVWWEKKGDWTLQVLALVPSTSLHIISLQLCSDSS